jgi:hypothetical protein
MSDSSILCAYTEPLYSYILAKELTVWPHRVEACRGLFLREMISLKLDAKRTFMAIS